MTLDVYCFHCQSRIEIEDVNIATDVALCRACGEPCRYSEVLRAAATGGRDTSEAPPGVWFESQPEGFRLVASTRSWNALFLVPFTCIWSGMSLSGLYGSQVAKGQFELFNPLFGLPFLIGTFVLIGLCAMSIAGRLVVTKLGDEFLVFQGVGNIGWTRKFAWSEFTTAREERYGRGQMVIVMEGGSDVKFGTLLSGKRRRFVLGIIRRMITATRFASR